jgi:hypothetical protein
VPGPVPDQRHRQAGGGPVPDHIYSVHIYVGAATYELDQLLGQLRGRLELVDVSRAYDDRRDRPVEQTIAEVAAEVLPRWNPPAPWPGGSASTVQRGHR